LSGSAKQQKGALAGTFLPSPRQERSVGEEAPQYASSQGQVQHAPS
jgi:hypothetical protein